MRKGFKVILCIVVLSTLLAAVPTPALASNGARGDQMIRVAMSYLGRPYVFGASGTRAFDCSSFVRQVVYQVTGRVMPRTAAAQSRVGRQIPRSALSRGDIIFFQNTYKRGVSHVGFFMGNNRIIHAMPRRGVVIDSLNTSYARAKYHSSRTVLR